MDTNFHYLATMIKVLLARYVKYKKAIFARK